LALAVIGEPAFPVIPSALSSVVGARVFSMTFVDKYAEDTPHRPSLVIYPGARHSFDAKRPRRVYFGHELAYDPKAAADAIERTRIFLDEHMHR
jgi:dienelactone hydrolase